MYDWLFYLGSLRDVADICEKGNQWLENRSDLIG